MAKKETASVRGIGDNGEDNAIDGGKLESFINKIEKLTAKKQQISDEIGAVFADCKAVGYDNSIVRAILKERKTDPEKVKEKQELLHLYRVALHMLDDEE
jgi:uncharacterized protein (UPF0335 family)